MLALLAIQAVGIVGFVLISAESVVDAFYRTAVLVSTVGLDSVPETGGAKIFSIFVVAAGVALFLYVVGLVVELAVSGVASGAWRKRRVRRTVKHLDDHYVICGYGRVGRRVADECRAAGVDFVVVDADPVAVTRAGDQEIVVVEGSATEDSVLRAAGIERARGLVACVGSDAENLYIVLSARELKRDLLIVSRADADDARTKLLRGGADRVVSPFSIAGKELATMVLKPQVSAFLEVVRAGTSPDFRFEEITVPIGSEAAGRTIRELAIRARTGALVVAHRRPGQGFNTRPDPDLRLEPGDVLIGVGTPDEIVSFENMFRPSEAIV